MTASRSIITSVEAYYRRSLDRFGPTPRGVDWSCAASQNLRFVQLLKVCDWTSRFSINDVGCGYGALLDFIAERHTGADLDYLGYDFCAGMIIEARSTHSNFNNARFEAVERAPRVADYSVASGIFNVKLDTPIDDWEAYIRCVLHDMVGSNRQGFAANFLLPAGNLPHPVLYRTDPVPWIAFCERVLNCSITCLTGYGYREFTLLGRPRPKWPTSKEIA